MDEKSLSPTEYQWFCKKCSLFKNLRMPRPKIVERPFWGAQKAMERPDMIRYEENLFSIINRITIHHSRRMTSDPLWEIRQLQEVYLLKGYGDTPFHYFVDRDGAIYEGREIGFLGSHVKGGDFGNIGILVLGDYDAQGFPSGRNQWNSLIHLIAWQMVMFNLSPSALFPHSYFERTDCPGAHIRDRMKDIKKTVRELLKKR